MRQIALATAFTLTSLLLAGSGCSFDTTGLASGRDGAIVDARGDTARQDAARDGRTPDGALDGPPPRDATAELQADVVSPDGVDPDTLAPDTLAPDTLAPDTLAPDTLAPDTGFPCSQCALGCDSANTRCLVLVPSTLTLQQVLSFDSLAVADCHLSPTGSQSYLVDTSALKFSACPGVVTQVFAQASGPKIAVFAVNTLRVGAKAQLRVTGSRALLIYARRTIEIAGTLDATAALHTPGPGGRAGGNDSDGSCWFAGGEGQAGDGKDSDDSGGGGGAWGEDGKRGGNAGGQKGGPGGKGAGATASVFSPFHGGCGGGAGASNPDAGRGGGGGGAVHLAAGLSVTISGAVTAGGGGGRGGKGGEGGGGGGSGGTILLESQAVTSSGILAANGGAGGSGSAPSSAGATQGNAGENGGPVTTRAVGGASVHKDSGKGGLGGALQDATNGQDDENAGGGGGGGGRIHVRSNSGPLGGLRSPPQTSDSNVSLL